MRNILLCGKNRSYGLLHSYIPKDHFQLIGMVDLPDKQILQKHISYLIEDTVYCIDDTLIDINKSIAYHSIHPVKNSFPEILEIVDGLAKL